MTFTGDCGELIAASYRGGVAHPSGYPFYSVLARAFAVLPWGEIAARYNFFSALCGATAVGIVAAIVARLTHASRPEYSLSGVWPPAGAALLLAGFTFFGAQCVIAETYALNAVLIAAIFASAIFFRQAPNPKQKFFCMGALALLLGLSFNSHLSIIFVWPGILVFLWPAKFRDMKFQEIKSRAGVLLSRRAAALLLLFLLGFSFTLYLPIRARNFAEPVKERIAGKEYSWFEPLDWGHPVDFARWKTHVTVGQYGSLLWKPLQISVGGRTFQTRQPAQTPAQALGKFWQWCGYLALQFLWTTPLLLVGAWSAFRSPQFNDGDGNRSTPQSTPNARGKRLGAMLLVVFALNTGVAMHYNVDNVFDIANFLFPIYIVLAIWMGLGIEVLFRAAKRNERVLALCRVLLVAAIFCQWFFFAQSASFRGNTLARDLALERAEAAEQLQKQTGRAPSLFLLNDDTLFPFWYVQKVLGHAPQTRTPWGLPLREYQRLNRLPQLIARHQAQGEVAIAQWDAALDQRFPYAPLNGSGSLWLLSKRALPPSALPVAAQSTPVALADGSTPIGSARFVRTRARRNETIGFQLVFRNPDFSAQKPLAIDRENRARHIGFVEVLVAPRGALPASPAPDVQTKLPIWKQTRRLVVPQNARVGQALQVLLSLQFPLELAPIEYDVWTRLVRHSSDQSTPWARGERVQIIVK